MPDIVLRRALFGNAFVLRRTPGLDSGVGYEGAVLGDMAIFLVKDSMLVKGAYGEVAVEFGGVEAVVLKIKRIGHGKDFRLWF
jgi:hypothetical protein